jgi:hypothetical protein
LTSVGRDARIGDLMPDIGWGEDHMGLSVREGIKLSHPPIIVAIARRGRADEAAIRQAIELIDIKIRRERDGRGDRARRRARLRPDLQGESGRDRPMPRARAEDTDIRLTVCPNEILRASESIRRVPMSLNNPIRDSVIKVR